MHLERRDKSYLIGLAIDLIGQITVAMKACGKDQLIRHLVVVLYKYLSEVYPEVLGLILGVLSAITNVIGITKMMPPICDLLPRLTPILQNWHDKVQENRINLISFSSCLLLIVLVEKEYKIQVGTFNIIRRSNPAPVRQSSLWKQNNII
eukprot:10033246-Ditylum_brightwellii.AAC.1